MFRWGYWRRLCAGGQGIGSVRQGAGNGEFPVAQTVDGGHAQNGSAIEYSNNAASFTRTMYNRRIVTGGGVVVKV